MTIFKLRPTFELRLREKREPAIERLKEACARVANPDAFRMFGEYGEFHLPTSEHRLWSPHLSFYVTEVELTGEIGSDPVTLVRGRFAPRLDIWTTVWIVYLAMSITAFYGVTLAYSQWMIGESAWGWWVALGSILVIAALTITAAVGQQLSVDQMLHLRQQLEQTLSEAELTIEPESLPCTGVVGSPR
jgi:hypothetical protein